MAGQKFTLTFDAQLNVSQMNGALKQIQSTLNGLHLPQNITRGLQGGIDKLQKEITSFESLASKDITSKADMSKLETQAQKVSNAFNQLRRSFANLTGLNGRDLEKLFPSNISKNITDGQKALSTYTKDLTNATAAVKDQKAEVDKLKQSITDLQNRKTYNNTEWKQLQNDIKATEAELEKYKQLKEQAEIKRDTKQAELPNTYKNSSIWRDAQKEIQKYQQEIDNTQKKLGALNQAKVTGIKQEDQIKALQKLNAELTVEQQKFQQLTQILQQLSSKGQGGGLQQLIEQVGQLTGLDMSQFKQTTQGVGEAIRVYLNQQLQQLGTNLNNAANSVNGTSNAFANNRQQVHECAEAYQQFNTQAREVEQLKSRIQYFFSLNNAIMLVKRTLREAYQTIKDLDKAMTETAVVTDFSVGDMWAQLPDYTARANELGVTTKAAYEAATLFYQQGLKTNEVMAMSNETLKMARIAGLDATVATDRMTNAIRGFNMEINETNAQRIDDVYSRLAAISASNVDEISTAMTKVASLAHNANMEFETTAAFLAQIIETTRESAETAGTALKTVVARFSEVKKLVDEGELSGKDEEGELIDVNKVSEALRTAGIDLNKYFLGEVGLDDIFMELASKWDSLTTIQQRYIATQAAGSRQQSRFIALMSDYARTQELVGEAYNANGASAKQFAKTQESLESKLARLKNAWNEFAMGILNSDLVKAGVDLLTNILNGVNALTSGFGQLNEGIGGVINSVSKLLMLFGGLGLGKTLLGGLTASISNIGLIAAGKAPLNVAKAMATSAVGAGATGAMGNLAARGAGGAMLAGFLNPFAGVGTAAKGIGTSLWGGLQKFGLSTALKGGLTGGISNGIAGGVLGLGGSAELAAGIAGIGTALTGVAVAAGAVVAAYKLWEKYTPEGQLKTAKKIAEANQKIADDTQAEADSLKNLQSSYDEYTKAVNEATSVEERRSAIAERNDAILKAIDNNPDFSQYLQTSFDEVSGELVLTLDSDAVTDAAKKAAEAATEAAINAYFSHADVSLKEAEVTLKELNAAKASAAVLADMNNPNYNMNSEFYGGSAAIDQDYVKEHGSEANIAKLNAEWIAATQAAQKQAQLAYARMIELADSDSILKLDEKVGQGTSQALAEVLGKVFVETGESLSQAVVEQLKNGLSEGTLDSHVLTATVADALEFSLSGIDLDTEEGFEEYLNQMDVSAEELEEFASILNVGEDVLRKYIKSQAKAIKEVQTGQRAKIYEQAFQNGIDITKKLQDSVQVLNSEQLDAVNNLLTSSEGLFGEDNKGFSRLFNDLPNLIQNQEVDGLFHLFNSINLDNPIQAFHKLNEISKTATGSLKEYADLILELNTESFSRSNMIKSFMMTEEYTEDLNKEIEKFIDENGKITPKNVEELADSSDTLRTILDDNIASAEGLADAINAINDGAPLEGLTDELLFAFDAIADVDDMIWQLHDTIANFDAGLDYSEGTEFIVDLGDQLSELLENFEIGNQQTQRMYDQLFGEGAYETQWNQFKAAIESGQATVEDFVNDTMARVTRVQEWAREESYNFMQEMAQRGELGITFDGTSENGDQFKWDVGDLTTEQLVAEVRKAAKRAGEEISDTTAMALIEGAMAHMPDLRAELKENDFSASVEELIKQHVKNAKDISQSEMEALAKSAGKDVEEVRQAIVEAAKKNPEVNFDIKPVVDWTYGDGSPMTPEDVINKFVETFGELDVALDMHVHGGEIDYEGLYNDLVERGLTPDQANAVADKLVTQIDNGLLTKKITIPNIEIDDNGNVINKPVEVPVYADTVEGLEAAAKAKLEAAEQNANYTIMSQQLAEQDYSGLEESILKYMKSAADQFGEYLQGVIDSKLKPGSEQGEEKGNGNVKVGYNYNSSGYADGIPLGKQTVAVETKLDEVSSSKLQEWVNQVGKITLTFTNEEEAKAKAEQIKNDIESDNLNLKISTDLIENPDETYSIEVQPSGLIEGITHQTQEYATNPLEIPAVAEIVDVKQPEETGVVETEGEIVDLDTTQADQKIAESANAAEQTIAEQTEAGYTTGAQQGADASEVYRQQVADDLYEKILNGEITSGEQGAAYISRQVDDQASALAIGDIIYAKLSSAGNSAAIDMAGQIQTALSNIVFRINVIAGVQGEGSVAGNQVAFYGGVIGSGSSAAKGGIVSRASGSASRQLKPGIALTGEEAPEIVWNKERGYAYITGQNGPEFQQLNPGDRVFNAQETDRILRNSSDIVEFFGSYATGAWNRTKIQERAAQRNKSSRSSSGSGSKDSSDKEKTPTVWENELDWLYNLIQDIGMLERLQTKLAERHDRYLSDISKTGRDLYSTSKEQLDNLKTQRDNARERLNRRTQEMNEQIGISGYGNYVWWNAKDQTLEIDWDAIEALQDKETYDEIVELIGRTEKIQDEIQAAQDTLWSTEKEIKDIEDRYLTEFTNYQSRVYDAVVYGYQQQIDKLSSLNDELNDANNAILNSLQKEIDYSRQIRDNTDTQNQLADMEARLAYMRRDTTGANASEIRQLEKQLADSRQSYEDTLIDQSLNSLKEANDQAAEQRERQINLMTAQLDYWKESGALWNEVNQLIASGIGNNGSLISGSDLEKTLQNAESWKGMSQEQREVWANDLILETNKAGAYLIKISEGLDGISKGVWANLPRSSVTSQKLDYGDEGYSTGGLNAHPGLAMLHGTPNEPEYVLNARQTDAFLRLSDVLPAMLGNDTGTMNNFGGNTFNLVMNVDQIANDYDVDRLVERVKQDIYDVSSYRNVNSIGFIR